MRFSGFVVPVISVFAVAVVSVSASAHVTVQPNEAELGAEVAYTLSVPSEGDVVTASVVLEIPAGVTVISIVGAPDSYEVKKEGDRITVITWKTFIPAGDRGEIHFVAKNPTAGAEITVTL